ncbi:helix-turn-helix transcriptional regulator [Polynucleobacter sp. Fuers-14]|uniref:helix-turn-helix domain-containing protein n=1 Tax=Polynucleobacter sp. Fuers-14 TaxID=1758364 RepID=UPI001C0B9DDB|nr:helix-turn-helix transcriptional regulator [Polynucleobacter sp. Fuers-14]MBU3641979.1 PAS domain-containing protein [Polynucleobacter sp. Fuers-14]
MINNSKILIDSSFFDGIALPVFIKDLNGKFVYCNQPFVEFLGISIQQVIGLSDSDIRPRKFSVEYAKANEELFRLNKEQSHQLITHESSAKEKIVFKKIPLCNLDNDVIGWIGSINDGGPIDKSIATRNDKLTHRENEVLSLLSMGLSVKGIAIKLHISPHTVSHHLKEVYTKLDAHSKNEAVFKANS